MLMITTTALVTKAADDFKHHHLTNHKSHFQAWWSPCSTRWARTPEHQLTHCSGSQVSQPRGDFLSFNVLLFGCLLMVVSGTSTEQRAAASGVWIWVRNCIAGNVMSMFWWMKLCRKVPDPGIWSVPSWVFHGLHAVMARWVAMFTVTHLKLWTFMLAVQSMWIKGLQQLKGRTADCDLPLLMQY